MALERLCVHACVHASLCAHACVHACVMPSSTSCMHACMYIHVHMCTEYPQVTDLIVGMPGTPVTLSLVT